MYKADSAPNIVASALYSMMKQQETFIDMCLIRSFHKAYINPHFDWLQTCNDLSGALGFAAHHIAVRHCLMEQDLKCLLSRRSFPDCLEAVDRWVDEDETRGRTGRARHLNKLTIFIHAAADSLRKHFPRWLNSTLLPAASLSEGPTAKVVAACMSKKNLPTFETDPAVKDNLRLSGTLDFDSAVHGQTIDMKKLCSFIKASIDSVGNSEHTPQAKIAADFVCQNDFDMRLKECETQHGSLRWHMHSTHLPLPCRTQFVESFVKEAANVSQTDRSEQHRSWCAIVRAFTPLARTEKDANANRIKDLISSALKRTDSHVQWRRNQIDNECEAKFATVSHALSSTGHFKTERIDGKKANVDDKGDKYKKQNVAQQTRNQYKTAAVTGLIPYGKLVKARNMLDLEEELLFRGVPMDAIPVSVSDRKDMLRQLEIERLMMDCGMSEDDAVSQKAFKKQSNAPFKLTD